MRYTSKENTTMEDFLEDMEFRVATGVSDYSSDPHRAIIWAIFAGWDEDFKDVIEQNNRWLKDSDMKFLNQIRKSLYPETKENIESSEPRKVECLCCHVNKPLPPYAIDIGQHKFYCEDCHGSCSYVYSNGKKTYYHGFRNLEVRIQ